MTPREARQRIRDYKLTPQHRIWKTHSGQRKHLIQLAFRDAVGQPLVMAKGVGTTRNDATVEAVQQFEQRAQAYMDTHPNWRQQFNVVAAEQAATTDN